MVCFCIQNLQFTSAIKKNVHSVLLSQLILNHFTNHKPTTSCNLKIFYSKELHRKPYTSTVLKMFAAYAQAIFFL